jgi:hypothetical protein
MNSPEVTKPHALPSTGLAAHAKALEAAGLTLRLVARVPLPFKPIADQAIWAAASVPATSPPAARRANAMSEGDGDWL